jgi:hypothetical protein
MAESTSDSAPNDHADAQPSDADYLGLLNVTSGGEPISIPASWSLFLQATPDTDRGFEAAAYFNKKTNQIVIAFRGPNSWTDQHLEELQTDLQTSIGNREQEQQNLGEDGGHRARIEDERRLLNQIDKRLNSR